MSDFLYSMGLIIAVAVLVGAVIVFSLVMLNGVLLCS